MLDIRLLAAKAVGQVRKAGLRGFATGVTKRCLYHPPTSDFDRIHQTDTERPVPLWRFHIPYSSAKFGVAYGTPSESRIREALELVPRDTTFLDLGSGKGRALIVAAAMGFREVIGVEFVAELVKIARRNLTITGAKAQVVLGDAGEYSLPSGPLSIYLYNPFSAEIMRKVVAKLAGRSDETWVVYLNPTSESGCADLFDTALQRILDRPGLAIWAMNRGRNERV